MKKNKILFWTSTIIIFIVDGLAPAISSQTTLFKDVIDHLRYPWYFGDLLIVFKTAGALILIIPKIPARVKEWAYAGFTFDLLFAFTSHAIVDGFSNFQPILLIVVLGILAISYFSYHKLNNTRQGKVLLL